MSNNSNSSRGGIGLMGVLFVTLLVLKLLDKIDWSWWWITAPLWGPLALVVLGFGVFAIYEIRKSAKKRKRLNDQFNEMIDESNGIERPKKSKFQIRLEEAMKAREKHSK